MLMRSERGSGGDNSPCHRRSPPMPPQALLQLPHQLQRGGVGEKRQRPLSSRSHRNQRVFSSSAEHCEPQQIARSLVPSWNTLVFFEVSPVSFHQARSRLSLIPCCGCSPRGFLQSRWGGGGERGQKCGLSGHSCCELRATGRASRTSDRTRRDKASLQLSAQLHHPAGGKAAVPVLCCRPGELLRWGWRWGQGRFSLVRLS